MKKIITLLTAGLALCTLAGCDKEKDPGTTATDVIKNVSGGTADEKEAIQKVAKGGIAMENGANALIPENKNSLKEDEGTFIDFTVSRAIRVNGAKYTVNFEWEMEENPYATELIQKNDTTVSLFPKYPGFKAQGGEVKINLKKASCGGAVSTNTEYKFTMDVVGAKIYHQKITIAEINALKKLDDGSYGYKLVDYTKMQDGAPSPYFYTNEENKDVDCKQYYYVECVGKVIYLAPDGNWGLIADGDQIMEIYAGAGTALTPNNWLNLDVGKYVKVLGNLGHYYGNIQIGYLTQILPAEASDLVNEPTGNFDAVTSSMVALLHNKLGGLVQCYNGANLSNALKSCEGTVVANSLLNKSHQHVDSIDSFTNGDRFTFQVELDGGEKVTIAYDYHVDSNSEILNALKAMYKDTTSTYKIKGTLRYSSGSLDDKANGFIQDSSRPGDWQFCPYDVSHIAKK